MILFLTQCFPSKLGGVESLVSNLALGLSKTENVIVFADQHNFVQDSIFDNKHKKLILVRRFSGIKFLRRRKKIKEAKLLIKSKQIKLIIGDSWKSFELGADYFKKNNIPMASLAHGNELLSNNMNKIKRIKKTLNNVNGIIANSIYTKNLIKNLIDSHIPVDCIYPGAMDLRNIKSSVITNIKGSPIILTLARLEKRKGHRYIIESVRKLLPEFPSLQYVIAGEGPEIKNLKKLVVDYRLQDNVIFTGFINESEKKYIFEKTELMVMPTLDETKNRSIEGFGIAYLEAAFFGIPSIASNVGGTPEAVINGSTGLIIENMDQLFPTMKSILNDKEKRQSLGKAAKQRSIKNFDWNDVIKKYILVFNKTYN